MKYETLPGGGQIPRLGLGTWRIGGNTTPDYSQDEQLVRVLRAAIEMGYTHFDTAEGYGGGHSEELVGRAMQGFRREDLFITSKVSPEHLRYRDVLRALEGSLSRLGTDYLDLYLVHWPNARIRLEETFEALNELVARGQIRHLGVSNFDLGLLKKAQQLSQTPLATNQVPYSLFQRRYVQNGVLAYCQENSITLTAYTPVEKGRVANHAVVRQIAQKYKATPAQVALGWLIRQPMVITIPKSSNLEHLKENLEAVALELSDEDAERLEQLA